MRVWIVETAPDYEPSTRNAIVGNLSLARTAILAVVERTWGYAPLAVKLSRRANDLPTEDIALTVSRQGNPADVVTLTGVHVVGTETYSLTMSEWQELKELGTALAYRTEPTQAGATRADEVTVAQWETPSS